MNAFGNGAEVDIQFKPYMIDIGTAQAGEDKEGYCKRRWGGSGWAPEFTKWDWWPNTFNAHRICVYLDEIDAARTDLTERQRSERGRDLVKKLFELTYERGENISPPKGAARAIEELGYGKADDAVRWLEQGGGWDEVVKADAGAKREDGVRGVPHFIISDSGGSSTVVLHGAQQSDAFLAAFKQVAS